MVALGTFVLHSFVKPPVTAGRYQLHGTQPMDGITVGEHVADVVVAAAEHRLVGPAEARPAALEPVGLVGQIGSRRLNSSSRCANILGLLVDPRLVDDALLDQPLAVNLADRRVRLDRRVHQRLGEARLVALIVAEAAIAPHVDDDVAAEAWRNSVASLQQKVTASGSSPLTWRIGAWTPLATSDG